MLFRSFVKSCPAADLRPPAWDVALVLNSLTAAPYEPLKDAEERLLAHKMLFLLAPASAKRLGELHALSHRVSLRLVERGVDSFTVPALPKSRDLTQWEAPVPGTSSQVLPVPHRLTSPALRATVRHLRAH